MFVWFEQLFQVHVRQTQHHIHFIELNSLLFTVIWLAGETIERILIVHFLYTFWRQNTEKFVATGVFKVFKNYHFAQKASRSLVIVKHMFKSFASVFTSRWNIYNLHYFSICSLTQFLNFLEVFGKGKVDIKILKSKRDLFFWNNQLLTLFWLFRGDTQYLVISIGLRRLNLKEDSVFCLLIFFT